MAEIEVTGIDLHDVEGFIRKAMSAGADSTGAIQYYSSTYDEIYDEALQEAIKQAHAKAEKMGEAAGFSVARVHQIQEGYQDSSYQYVTNLSKSMGMDEMAMNDASYPATMAASPLARLRLKPTSMWCTLLSRQGREKGKGRLNLPVFSLSAEIAPQKMSHTCITKKLEGGS